MYLCMFAFHARRVLCNPRKIVKGDLHAVIFFFLHFTRLCACLCPADWEPRRADEVWEGVNDSDIITACRLVLFHCPDADRSSIVPALRGLPRFPCVRNHPPTCYSRQGPKTMKLYTESLWAAGRALMKDSGTVERITNARLLDTVLFVHTHTHVPAETQCRHTHPHTDIPAGTHTHKVDEHIRTLSRYRLIQPRLKGQWELESEWGWVERWVAGEMDGCWWIGRMRRFNKSRFTTAELVSGSAQSWFGRRPGRVRWHRWTRSHCWLTVSPQIIKMQRRQKSGESVYLQTELDLNVRLHLHLLKSCAGQKLFVRRFVSFCLSTRCLGEFYTIGKLMWHKRVVTDATRWLLQLWSRLILNIHSCVIQSFIKKLWHTVWTQTVTSSMPVWMALPHAGSPLSSLLWQHL